MLIWRMILLRIFYIIMSIHCASVQKVNIGIINGIWKELLESRLADRNITDKCTLIDIIIPHNISFYESSKKAYELISRLDLIIGDSRLDVAQAAATLSIPFIAFDSKLHITSRPEYTNIHHFYSLPVSEEQYALATIDVLHYYNIKNVAIIVDETVDYKNFIQTFFETKSLFSKVWTIPLPMPPNDTNVETAIGNMLKEIRTKGYNDIIVKTSKTNFKIVFEKARYHGMIANPTRWYLPNFVCENFDISNLKHIFSNFTLINEDCSERTITDETKSEHMSLINQFLQITRVVKWNFKSANLYRMLKNNPKSLFSFDERGNRNQFTFILHTIARQPDKLLSLIGSWQKRIGSPRMFNIRIKDTDIEYLNSEFPSHLRIVAVEEHPHLIVKENNTYVGFGVDLIRKLSLELKFNFSISIVNSYGNQVRGRWDGLIGELIYGRSDLSLGPVVQTQEREEILDFSTTFKQREISLVMKKPNNRPSLFQFLGPFSNEIWLCVISSIILLIIILVIIERYHDKYFPEEDRIKFNLKESSWFIVASTLQGGTENVPFSVPGRILTGTLYFFVMIIVTSYTANLAAFLTLKAYSNPIKSVDDLVNLPSNSKISFGTVGQSAIHDFFKHSEIPSYQKLYKLMTVINNGWLVNSSAEGYRRAIKENYVFIWDDSINQYEIFTEPEYKCQLYLIGRPFGKRSFAISMSQGSCFKEKINSAILNLLESGVVENLEHRWWKSSSICINEDTSSEAPSGSLSMEELAGVFLVLLCGSVLAIFSLIVKIVIYKYKAAESFRGCCSQFFAQLPIEAERPLQPKSPRTTADRSQRSTIASSAKTDNLPSTSAFTLRRFFPSNNALNDDTDDETLYKDSRV